MKEIYGVGALSSDCAAHSKRRATVLACGARLDRSPVAGRPTTRTGTGFSTLPLDPDFVATSSRTKAKKPILTNEKPTSQQIDPEALQSIWRFVPLSDRKIAAAPADETIRNNLRGLWTRLSRRAVRSSGKQDEDAIKNLHTVPQGLLEWIAPAPTWADHGTATLDQALEPWLTAENQEAGARVLVAPPHSGVVDMVLQWSRHHEYAIIKPPSPEQILTSDRDWMQQWEQNRAERLVLPWLERCFLRHHTGLDLARRLLDWLWESERPCLLVVDSWAWKYLQYVHHLEAFVDQPLTLDALDAWALDKWLTYLSQRDRGEIFLFREEVDETIVLQTASNGSSAQGEDAATGRASNYLRYLAARSRGISGVAWAIWRHSLKIKRMNNEDQSAKAHVSSADQTTIWVTPWEDVTLPYVSARVTDDELFVLHNLLLHNGLPEEVLPKLLPFSSTRSLRALQTLRSEKLVAAGHAGWQVTPLAYPSVRAHLSKEGYLADEL